jgi:hypothetical protein
MKELIYYAIFAIILYFVLSQIFDTFYLEQENFDPSLIPVSSIVTLAKIGQKLVNGNGIFTNPGNLQIGMPTAPGNLTVNGNLDIASGKYLRIRDSAHELKYNESTNKIDFQTGNGMKIFGNLEIASNTQGTGTLTVNGQTNANGSLSVTGDTSISGTLTVNSLTGNVTANGAFSQTGGSNCSFSGDTSFSKNVSITGQTNVNRLTVTGPTSISSQTNANGGLSVTGTASINGQTDARNGLKVSGSTSIATIGNIRIGTNSISNSRTNDDLEISCNNTSKAVVIRNSNLTVEKDLNVVGTLTIGGVTLNASNLMNCTS